METHASESAELEELRPRLFGIAYRMLGSVQDAEDLVQEAYLRWHVADTADVRAPEAWLVTVVTRLSIDRLRHAVAERAAYAGQWLPEPLAGGALPAPDRGVELASDLSMAFMVLLERLGPEERAAFLLHDVFDAGYDEIARVLEKSETACRQLVHRARERVRRDRARFDVPPDARERLLERFLAALAADDRDALVSLFADEATWTSDGGGKVPSTRRVVHGADRIARLLLGFERKGGAILRHRIVTLNGEPALLSTAPGYGVFATTHFAIEGTRIVAAYRVMNPDKLHRIGQQASPTVSQ